MIPISDDNPVRITPYVTWAIIALCVAVFLWELSLGPHMAAASYIFGFVPATLFAGVKSPSAALGIPGSVTLFTSMFLHGGFMHIAGNMLYLWIFGNNVEEAMGHFRYLLFYLASGLAAAFTMALMDPLSTVPMIGASGAISGVLGGYVLLYPRARVTAIVPLGILFYPLRVSAIWVVGLWFLLQLLNAVLSDPNQPGVAWWAHVGGFAMGLLLTPFFKTAQYRLFGDVRRGPWG